MTEEARAPSAERTSRAGGHMANLVTGRMVGHLGPRRVLIAAALLMAASLAGLLPVGDAAQHPVIVVQLVALGFGLGVVVPAVTAALLGSVEQYRSGIASGTRTPPASRLTLDDLRDL